MNHHTLSSRNKEERVMIVPLLYSLTYSGYSTCKYRTRRPWTLFLFNVNLYVSVDSTRAYIDACIGQSSSTSSIFCLRSSKLQLKSHLALIYSSLSITRTILIDMRDASYKTLLSTNHVCVPSRW